MRKAIKRLAVLAGLAAAVLIPASAMGTSSTGLQHFTVAFTQTSGLPADVDQLVQNAGGTITAKLPEVGGISVDSSNPNFATDIAKDNSVKAAGLSIEMSVIDPIETSGSDNNAGNTTPTGTDAEAMPDPLGYEQWDKKIMNASLDGSYAVQQGRKDVKVFVTDTGADQFHPDIAPNLDVADSKSFVPSEPTIQDFNGHGSWTISAVGAPINGIGISGVAPNVTLVEGKVLDATGHGQFFWLAQALVYAGEKHFDVLSASLGGYIPKCGSATNPNGCDHPDFILLNRATQFARSNGVLPIGALGNDSIDLADGHFFQDYVEAPGTLAGWVGVSATGYHNDKAWYSNYGSGATDVAAPGGSTRDYRGTPGLVDCGGHGGLCRLIGAYSSTAPPIQTPPGQPPLEECADPAGTPPCVEYAYEQGTSMATPNAAGVAALIVSQYGDFSSNNQNKPHMAPTAVEQILEGSANNQPCPEPNTVIQGPGTTFGTPTASCQGGQGYNSFFGKGIVDALKAVTYKG